MRLIYNNLFHYRRYFSIVKRLDECLNLLTGPSLNFRGSDYCRNNVGKRRDEADVVCSL